MKIQSKFMTGLVSRIVKKVLRTKLGCEVDIQLNEFRTTVIDDKTHVHLDLDADLTPIEDDPDIWTKVEFGENDPIQHFQCKRMSSLFKDVAEDGTVTYSDVNRVQLINKESPDIPFRNGFGTRLIDKMYPITLPYFPADKKFKIIIEEFLTDEKNGDFDTVGYLQLILPNGEVVDLNGYFKDGPDGMVRIEQAEYEERKANRIDKK